MPESLLTKAKKLKAAKSKSVLERLEPKARKDVEDIISAIATGDIVASNRSVLELLQDNGISIGRDTFNRLVNKARKEINVPNKEGEGTGKRNGKESRKQA
ncbi:MAG: hypothetical protein KGI50_05635 [Patescibacteria group bacterium]|nr:hypothetical protein [Patescibacteria group bacterium]